MGLDMYLSRKYYVKNWNHTEDKNHHIITITKGGEPSLIPTNRITDIVTEEITWRKANAIHQWFVDNIQDKNDDCREYYVSEEKLAELLDIINKIIKDPSKAPELLPTNEGFFFGDTSYGDNYFLDLEETQKVLSVILLSKKNEKDIGEFYYRSSW